MMKTNIAPRIALSILLLLASVSICSQTAFKAGELLNYSLYYNWKFIWVKAGSATMSISQANYQNKPAYHTRLIMRGSPKADNYFILRDTLISIVSLDKLKPLYYLKRDIEGSSRRKREVWYSYPDNSCRVRQQYTHKSGAVTFKDETRISQVHDMLSIMLNARNFDTSDWKPGKKINFLMTDGNGVEKQTLIYRGKQKIKMRGEKTSYQCLKLSFVEYQDKKEKEVVTFFVTDDANHVPVRLDMYLRFGSAKAFLTGSKGLKNHNGDSL